MITVRVTSFLKPGVLDAEGQAVREGLRMLGHTVQQVRVGRSVELTLPEADWQQRLETICRSFLVNPLIEDYRWEVVAGPEADAAP